MERCRSMRNPFKKQIELTDASSISKLSMASSVPGMAYFAGTGPEETVCGQCQHWVLPEGKRKHICAEFRRMTKDDAMAVPRLTPSCKYFEKKNA